MKCLPLTRNSVDVISPRSSLSTSRSVWTSALSKCSVSPRSRCTPTSILNINHWKASFYSFKNAFLNCICSSLVVSPQKSIFPIQLRNSPAKCVFKAANSLDYKATKMKLNLKTRRKINEIKHWYLIVYAWYDPNRSEIMNFIYRLKAINKEVQFKNLMSDFEIAC